jgi:hypothetical protein
MEHDGLERQAVGEQHLTDHADALQVTHPLVGVPLRVAARLGFEVPDVEAEVVEALSPGVVGVKVLLVDVFAIRRPEPATCPSIEMIPIRSMWAPEGKAAKYPRFRMIVWL